MEVAGSAPIVFLPATDPVQSGFVSSLATPRTNLTGLTFFIDSESVGKQLEVFRQMVPSLRQVVVLTDGRPDAGMNNQLRARLNVTAARLGVELQDQLDRAVTNAFSRSFLVAALLGLLALVPILLGRRDVNL